MPMRADSSTIDPHAVHAGAMAFHAGQTAGLGPSPVSIHNDGDMPGQSLRRQPDRRQFRFRILRRSGHLKSPLLKKTENEFVESMEGSRIAKPTLQFYDGFSTLHYRFSAC